MSEYCKGCDSYSRLSRYHCSFAVDNKEGDCPCTNCLVKVPCDGTEICKLWDEWTGSIVEKIAAKDRGGAKAYD